MCTACDDVLMEYTGRVARTHDTHTVTEVTTKYSVNITGVYLNETYVAARYTL